MTTRVRTTGAATTEATAPSRATVRQARPEAPKTPAEEIGPDGGLTRSLQGKDDPAL